MNKQIIILWLLMSSWLVLPAQQVINGTFTGLSGEQVSLLQTFAGDKKLIDTTHLNENGSFRFKLPDNMPAGMYALITESGMGLDIICNGEDLQFVLFADEYGKYVQVIKSVENMIYYDLLNLKQNNLLKLDILDPVLNYYPKKDPFYKEVDAKVANLRKEILDRSEMLRKENPETMAAHFIRVETPVFAPAGITEDEQKEFLKSHYLDRVDFTDTILLKSSLLDRKIISYLSLYQNREDDRETFEKNLLQGVDSLLNKAAVSQVMYEYLVDFLLEGFESVGFDRGMEYISEHNRLDDFCTNTEKLEELKGKLELINRLSVGKRAPYFSCVTLSGDSLRLEDIEAEKILLVFWASWCPHCKSIIPDINNLAATYTENELKIIGISVDTSMTSLKEVVGEYNVNWPVTADGKGWEGEIAEMYGIAATPTMYLLDSEKKIIAKPINQDDLKEALQR